ncbi:unnamed protein product, partial [Linum tenue]
ESREEELSLLCFFEGSRGDPLLSSEKKSPSPFLSPSHEEEEPASGYLFRFSDSLGTELPSFYIFSRQIRFLFWWSVHEGNGRNLPNDDSLSPINARTPTVN